MKEVNPHALSGIATSVANTGVFLGTGILQPLVGWTIDRAGLAQGAAAQYHAGMLIFFACVVFGFVASLRVRETYCRYLRHLKPTKFNETGLTGFFRFTGLRISQKFSF